MSSADELREEIKKLEAKNERYEHEREESKDKAERASLNNLIAATTNSITELRQQLRASQNQPPAQVSPLDVIRARQEAEYDIEIHSYALVDAVTRRLFNAMTTAIEAVPDTSTLKTTLQACLGQTPLEEKIPWPLFRRLPDEFGHLFYQTPHQFARVFVVAVDIYRRMCPHIDTEMGLQSLLDPAFLLIEAATEMTFSRDASHPSSVSGLRPDRVLGNLGVFRVEDKHHKRYKKGDNKNDPALQLVESIPFDDWPALFGALPYVLGCYCISTAQNTIFATFCYIDRDTKTYHDLVKVEVYPQRSDFVSVVIRIAPYIRWLNANVEFTPLRVTRPLKLVESTTRQGRLVVKCVWQKQQVHLAQNVVDVMERLGEEKVDKRGWAIPFEPIRVDAEKSTAYFTPYGRYTAKPRNLQELKFAVLTICRVLKRLHERDVVHCDLRWPNVVRAFDYQDFMEPWFLVDFEDAAIDGQRPDHKLSDEEHCPALRTTAPVSPAVDVWGVGHLLTSATVSQRNAASRNVGNHIKAEFSNLSMDDVVALVEGIAED